MTIGFNTLTATMDANNTLFASDNHDDDQQSAAVATPVLKRRTTTSATASGTTNTVSSDNKSSNNSSSSSPSSSASSAATPSAASPSTPVAAASFDDATVAIAENNVQIMPEDYSRKLVTQIQRRLDAFLAVSPFIHNNASLSRLPRYSRSQLNLGKTLARGGFSTIVEVHELTQQQQQQQQSQNQYVVKCLSTSLPLKKLPGATKDIVLEAHTLSALHHESIVAVRGWSCDGIHGFETTRRADGFFLVLDRLGDTLFQRVFQWQSELKRARANAPKVVGGMLQIKRRQLERVQFQEKISICLDIASALAYCHERRIMHRDIKSANVAFDLHDTTNTGFRRAKLIDFGLACELPPLDPSNPHKTFEMTGNIGTARYMAPEVILENKYNEKADVHSFAVLCWEACAAKKPYSHLDAPQVKEHVSKWHERPSPYMWSWPRKLNRILKRGWAKRPQDRPSMAEFHKALLKVQQKLHSTSNNSSLLKTQ